MILAPDINIETYLLKLRYHLGRRGIVLSRQITVLTHFKNFLLSYCGTLVFVR